MREFDKTIFKTPTGEDYVALFVSLNTARTAQVYEFKRVKDAVTELESQAVYWGERIGTLANDLQSAKDELIKIQRILNAVNQATNVVAPTT